MPRVKLSPAELGRLGVVAPSRASKYRNVRTEYNGQWYDSKAEAAWAQHLDLVGAFDAIRLIYRQPRFRLGCPENVYVGDFLVVCRDGSIWVDDVKGAETAKFRRDRKLWAAYGPCRLRIIRDGMCVESIEGGQAS